MKRRRSSASGRLRPDGRYLPSILLAVLAFGLAACGQGTATDRPEQTVQATGPTDSTSPAEPPGSPSEAPSSEAPPGSAEPTTPSPPASATAPPSGSSSNPGSTASCSGSDENRDFFASMAAAVDWVVYCPVLPDGWFVEDGHYRLAGGGWMEIVYDGPASARLTLLQGALGDAAGGCHPPGTEAGPATFGDQTGILVDVATGGWAVVVDRGETVCWVVVTTEVDEATTRSIAEDLLAIAG